MVEVDSAVVVTMAIYLIGMIGVGVWMYQRTDSLDGFVLGGRSLGPLPAALSAQASDMSGWLLLGLPGAIYVAGLGEAWIGIGLLIGTYLNWRFVAERLRNYTQRANNSITLSDYFEHRFEDRTRLLRIVSALVIIFFFSIYVSSGLVAGGLLFEQVFGIDSTTAITISVGVIMVYTLLGGFLAVSYTDAFQGLLMVGALIIVPVLAVIADGGFAAMNETVRSESPSLLQLFGSASLDDGVWSDAGALGALGIISAAAWGLGYFGQPHILARFMGIRDASMVPLARKIGVTWVAVSLAGAVLVGIAGIAFFAEPLENPETVFISLITETVNPWVGGILLMAVLAAVMSTADSQLLVTSSALTEDVYRAFIDQQAPQKRLLWIGRITTVGVALFAYVLALGGGTVLDLVAYAWAGFGAAFGPVIVLSLYWSRMTAPGALAGMVVGSGSVVLFANVIDLGIYEIVPGVILSTIAVVAVSRITTPPVRSWQHLDTLEADPV